jgi:hypothetical protein
MTKSWKDMLQYATGPRLKNAAIDGDFFLPHDALWHARKCERERTGEAWQQFVLQLIPRKMVRVVSDGGANLNPRSAGWGALIRQNGSFTWMYGHWHMASNNKFEALRILPEGFKLCQARSYGVHKELAVELTEELEAKGGCEHHVTRCFVGGGCPAFRRLVDMGKSLQLDPAQRVFG